MVTQGGCGALGYEDTQRGCAPRCKRWALADQRRPARRQCAARCAEERRLRRTYGRYHDPPHQFRPAVGEPLIAGLEGEIEGVRLGAGIAVGTVVACTRGGDPRALAALSLIAPCAQRDRSGGTGAASGKLCTMACLTLTSLAVLGTLSP